MTDFKHRLPDGFIQIHGADDFPVAVRVSEISAFLEDDQGRTLLYLRDVDEPFSVKESTQTLSILIDHATGG